MVNYFDGFYYQALLLSPTNEKVAIGELLQGLYDVTAQYQVSELIDLNKYVILKKHLRIRKILKNDFDFPFEFVHTLN